jgi:two-component system chemotaxis response regulator CheY
LLKEEDLPSMMDHTRTVLIVEDSDDCAETLELALQSIKGVKVVVAGSAEEALERLSQETVAAMITDLHLPQMDGLSLLSIVRARNNGGYTPVLVISGDSDPRTPARVLAAGAEAFFSKPYSPAAVRRKLEEVLAASGRNGNGSSG